MQQVPKGGVDLQPLIDGGQRPLGGRDEIALDPRDVRLAHRLGNLRQVSPPKASALGASIGQPPSASARCALPSQGRAAYALRPAWAPGTAPGPFTNRLMRASSEGTVPGRIVIDDALVAQPTEQATVQVTEHGSPRY